MKRAKSTVLITLMAFAFFIVLISPFVGTITNADTAWMTTAIAIMGAAYFGMVSPKREEVSPLITLTFVGFAMMSTSIVGVFVYEGVVESILLSIIFIIIALMEVTIWFYTAVYEVKDVPPIVQDVIPERVLPDHHTKLSDFQNSNESLNQER